MTLPLAKLAVLAIKQLTKPCASALKRTVKNSEMLGNVLAYPAQGYHRIEQTVRMRLLGWNNEVTIKPLSKNAATDLGAELASELFVFGIAVVTLTFEVRRSSGKEKAKQEATDQQFISLQNQINDLNNGLNKQTDANLKLLTLIDELVNKIECKEDAVS